MRWTVMHNACFCRPEQHEWLSASEWPVGICYNKGSLRPGGRHARSRPRHPPRHRGDGRGPVRAPTSASASGRIVALAEDLPRGAREIDAAGKLVLPGGVDSHCHIEQLSGMGIWNADDFESGTVSAAFGGTTTVIPFAAQHRGQAMREVVADYRERAKKAVVDHAFHMIVSDPSEAVMAELPALIRDGYSSLKLFMTYPLLRLDDAQVLDLLALARAQGAMVSVHAENDAMLAWTARRLLERGHKAPRYHAISHPRIAEAEATNRLIAMAALVDQPVVVFHVSTEGSLAAIRAAQTRGQKVFAETCPQYLLFGAEDLDKPGLEGRQVDVQPAGARCRGPGGDLAGPAQRHLPDRLVRSRALSLRRQRQARRRARGHLQADRERHPRHRAAPAAAVLRGRAEGADRSPALRRARLHQPRQDLRPASAQGHDRDRVGCRRRDLGSGPDGRDHRPDHPRSRRLLPLRRDDRAGLAGHGDRARRGDRRRRRAAGGGAAAAASCRAPPARPRGRPGRLLPEIDPARNFGAELL